MECLDLPVALFSLELGSVCSFLSSMTEQAAERTPMILGQQAAIHLTVVYIMLYLNAQSYYNYVPVVVNRLCSST